MWCLPLAGNLSQPAPAPQVLHCCQPFLCAQSPNMESAATKAYSFKPTSSLPWKRPVHVNNWQRLSCVLAQPCALWWKPPHRWGNLSLVPAEGQCPVPQSNPWRGPSLPPDRSLQGHAAPSSSWAAPVPSSQGREAKVWVQGRGFILQRWAVSRGGDRCAGSSSTGLSMIGQRGRRTWMLGGSNRGLEVSACGSRHDPGLLLHPAVP